MGKVVLYMTSTPTTLKLKHDIRRVQELLAAKNIPHEEVQIRTALVVCLLFFPYCYKDSVCCLG